MSNTTASIPGEPLRGGEDDEPSFYGLLLVWAAKEWRRLGELILFNTLRRTFSVGRTEDSERALPRARLQQQRPGTSVWMPPIASIATSRDQLLVTARVDGLDVVNIGKRPMYIDGDARENWTLQEGQLLYIEQQFLFMCVRRKAGMPMVKHLHWKYVQPFGEPDGNRLVGESLAAWEARDKCAFVAKTPHHVFLRGDRGTGKEGAAHAIHAMSDRARGPFVSASMAAFTSTILHDELFGQVVAPLRAHGARGRSARQP